MFKKGLVNFLKNSVVVALQRSSTTGNPDNKSSLPLNENSNGNFKSWRALRMGCKRNQTLFSIFYLFNLENDYVDFFNFLIM